MWQGDIEKWFLNPFFVPLRILRPLLLLINGDPLSVLTLFVLLLPVRSVLLSFPHIVKTLPPEVGEKSYRLNERKRKTAVDRRPTNESWPLFLVVR